MSHVVLLLKAVKGHCLNSTKPFAEPDKAYLLMREMKKTQILVLSHKIANIGPWGYKKPCHTSFYCWMLSRGMVWTQLSHSKSQTRHDWWSRKWKNTNFEHVATKSHHHHYPLINMQHLICIKLSGYKRPASTQVLNIIRMVNFTRRIGFPLVCYILSYKYTVWKSTNYDN